MKVLVVDDSQSVRIRVRRELESAGHEVVEAASGEDALGMLPSARPDALTLDIDMPGMSGFEACSRIRCGNGVLSEFRELPIVFLSANDSSACRIRSYEVGANGYVVKPFANGELRSELEEVALENDQVSGRAVLVVDDSPTVRSFLRSGLKESGLTVVEASNGIEALEILRRDSSSIDLAVIDYVMPEMDGEELFYAMRRELCLRDLPVLFLSANDEKDFMLRMFKAGAADYLIKPFSREELQARVNVHLRSKILGDQLRRTVGELKREYKLKDQLLSICSHDLRAPLNGVVGFANCLLMDELEEEQRDSVEQIKSSGEFMLSIISDILDFGRLQADDGHRVFAPVDLAEIVESCFANLRHVANPKSIALRLQDAIGQPGKRLVNGDANALRRLVNNLVGNSIKFSHPGSEVVVSLAVRSDGGLALAVIDRGIGIPADKQASLFEMGAKASQIGTGGEPSFGLGMSIVKRIAQQHRGEVQVASEPGCGTTVTISFPAHDRN